MPFPFSRKTFPLCVPEGIFIFTLPSSVGTSMVEPSAACVKLIGTSQITSVSSRMKMGCSWTCTTTYRSPGGPPRSPGSPSPVSLRRVPVSTPGGTLTLSTLSVSTLPAPRQVAQGSVTTLPAPWQWEQVREIWKNPCVIRSSPAPWQVGQVLGEVPGFAPEPWQVEHCLCRWILTLASLPTAASVQLTSSVSPQTLPRCLAPRRRP